MLFFVRLIAAAVWTVFGLLLWIPMIVRSFALQTGALLLSALTDTDTAKYDAMFTRVMRFYPNGFMRIFSNGSLSDATEADEIKFGRAFFEVVFAALFYAITIFAYYSVFVGILPMKSNFLDGIASTFNSGEPVVQEYRNAYTIQDYSHQGLFSSTAQRSRFQVLRVSAPSDDSSRTQLQYRICNLSENNTMFSHYAYFTDSASKTFRWKPQSTGTIEPGACEEGVLSSDTTKTWKEMDFRNGQFTFKFGSVSASIRVSS